MKDEKKTKKQLINELSELRKKLAHEGGSALTDTLENSPSQISDQRFAALLDSLDYLVYIADLETYEVLFINKYGRDIWGDIVGEKCWEAIQSDQSGPCDFCTNDRLLDEDGKPTDVYQWEFQNTVNKRWYECRDQAILWKANKLVRMEIALDITERKMADEVLKESENRFRLLSEASPIGAFQTDNEGRVLFTNNRWQEITGMSLEDSLGYGWGNALHPDDKEQVLEEWTRCLEEVKGYDGEFRFVRPDGEVRWLHTRTSPVRLETGEVIGHVGTNDDITEHKRADEAVFESEKKYRSLYDSMNEGVCVHEVIYDENGKAVDYRIIDVNNAYMSILDIKAEDAVGKLASELYGTGEPPYSDIYFKVADTGEACSFETYFPPMDKHFHISVFSPARDKFATVFLDISDKKRADEALEAEKERLAVTLRSIGDGVIATDHSGKVLLINKVAENLTGWIQEDAIGKELSDVFHIINEKTRELCENPVDKVLESGAIKGLANHTVLISKDGMERVIADSGAPIRDGDSNIIGVVLVFRDITNKIKMEEELQNAAKLESVGILAGGIAHDFNNILTALWGNISLVRLSTDLSINQVKLLNEAEVACQRAADLTKQLLTFSKGGEPIKKKMPVASLIKDSSEFALRGSNVRCHFSIPDDLWMADLDEGQINQVLNNIIINADQAMPDGGTIHVSAENHMLDTSSELKSLPMENDKYVKITIKDKGIGIVEEHLNKIFEPYFTTKQSGSGLGLATCYSIIRKHDGHISVESIQGAGTTFYIYLPASDEEGLDEKKAAMIVEGYGKILVMDDEDQVQKIAGAMLERLGYEVEFASNGDEAIQMYKKAEASGTPYDVVILDLTIPGEMGGKKCLEKLFEINPDVKAVVSSGYSTDPVMSSYEEHGFKGVLPKPFTIEQASEVLGIILGKRNS